MELEAFLRDKLEGVQDELARLMQERTALLKRIEDLQAEEKIALKYLREVDPSTSARPAVASMALVDDWNLLTRAAAIRRVLREANGPITLKEMQQELESKGFAVKNTNPISAVLGRMRDEEHEAIKVGHGVWIHRDSNPDNLTLMNADEHQQVDEAFVGAERDD